MLGLVMLAALVQQQAPSISAEVDRERVTVGEAITLTIRAQVKRGGVVQVVLPSFDGFALIGRDERRDQGAPGASEETYVLELRLRAQRIGLWPLGPVVLQLGTEDLSSPEVEVSVEAGGRPAAPVLGPRVLDMLQRAPPPAAGDVAVTLLVSADSVLVGEQVDVVTAAWFPRELLGRLRRPPTLRPPAIDGMYTAVQPSTAGVAASRMVGGTTWYDLYVAHQIVFPVSQGEVVVPPAGLSFSVPAGRQYFSEERAYTLASHERTIHVLPVPPGGPGPVAKDLVIGYELRPEPARAGEPLRVDLVLSGVGNSALWPKPVVSWPDGSRGYPESVEERPMLRNGVVGGLRRFRFVVIADSAGSLALPEVRYPYFDPDRGWRDATARPMVLPVQPAPPINSQRPPPRLLEREPFVISWLRGWVQWILLLLIVIPPLGFVLSEWRRRRIKVIPPPPEHPAERLQAAVRSLVPHPERRREEELSASLREVGFETEASEEIARLYQALAVRRFAPAQAQDDDVDRRAERILSHWPSRARRAVLAGSLLLLVIPQHTGAQTSADSLYSEGRFSAAAVLYQREAAQVPTSPRRWYAAGAAAWAAGQNAGAAAAWLTALHLAPRSRDIRQAWTQVSRFSSDLQRIGRGPPITAAELVVLAGLVWAGGWGLLVFRRHRLGAAVLALAGLIAISGVWLEQEQARPVAILARDAQLREAPHGLADETGRGDELSVVTVVERHGAWRLVETGSGTRGWLPATAMAEVRGVNFRP